MANNKSVGHSIAVLNRFSQMYFKEALEEFGLHGPGQLRIVMTLARHDKRMSQDEVAGILMVDKASISKMILPLIKNRVVVRETNPNDRRAYCLRLNASFRQHLPEIRERAKKWTEVLTEGMPEGDRERLFSYLERLETNAQAYLERSKV